MTRHVGVIRRVATAVLLGMSLCLLTTTDVTAFSPPLGKWVRSVGTVPSSSIQPSQSQQPPQPSSISTIVTALFLLRSNVKIPLLDLLDDEPPPTKGTNQDDFTTTVTPLPSSHLPPELATPFLYGMQVDRPVHKRLLQEAITLAATTSSTTTTTFRDTGGTIQQAPAIYGHLVWKPQGSSLVGAIGCTAQILVNAPTTEVLSSQVSQDLMVDSITSSSSSDDTPTRMVLCRGGFRFVVKEVLTSIPFPVAIVDEIQDDAEMDDSDMFASVISTNEEEDEDNDDEDDHTSSYYSSLSGAELLQKTMRGIQTVLNQKREELSAKQLSPLEKQILQSSGVTVDPNAIEQAQMEEMVAVFDVFQEALVDEISPDDRKFAIAMMAAELADMNNSVRQQVLLTRDAQERLRIVWKELEEMIGMANARKVANQITGTLDEDERDLKVGQPQLPPWAKTIVKGTKVEYFWNEEYGWCSAEIISDPVTVVDEILLTVRFEDGEVHTLPLSAEDKVRWRPQQK